MICGMCHQETYVIFITRNYGKICDHCKEVTSHGIQPGNNQRLQNGRNNVVLPFPTSNQRLRLQVLQPIDTTPKVHVALRSI